MAGLNNYVKRWRTALHVTVSALIVAILGLAITPVAHAAAATATLSVTSTWQTGFIAHFTITNLSTVPLTDWKLEFDLPMGESVSHTWNSTPCTIWHALCSHPRELESHHCTRWFSHRWSKRRADRFLLATVELSAQRAIFLHLEATAN